MKVKICGIRNEQEALSVAQFHPDAIGIILEGIGTNVIPKEKARQIAHLINGLPVEISTYLLTDTADPRINIEYASFVGSTHIQLKGNVSPEDVKLIKRKLPQLNIVKVVHVTGEEAVEIAKSYQNTGVLDSLLLDSRSGDMTGGTGKVHDWSVSRRIVAESAVPVWLAGGLNPGNLRRAIEQVHPQGVDVETGVQNPDGTKNYDRIREFIEIARVSDRS